jgi:hypothetical protein
MKKFVALFLMRKFVALFLMKKFVDIFLMEEIYSYNLDEEICKTTALMFYFLVDSPPPSLPLVGNEILYTK